MALAEAITQGVMIPRNTMGTEGKGRMMSKRVDKCRHQEAMCMLRPGVLGVEKPGERACLSGAPSRAGGRSRSLRNFPLRSSCCLSRACSDQCLKVEGWALSIHAPIRYTIQALASCLLGERRAGSQLQISCKVSGCSKAVTAPV